MKSLRFWFVFILCLSLTTFSLLPARAQSTISTGSIQGTVTDPNGAVVPDANITITNKATGQVSKVTSSGSGTYASGGLIPGEYEVRVEGKGFQTQVLTVPVQVGNITPGNVKMTLGASTEVVEVTGSAVTVNTEQNTVQGVLTTQQIENLPIKAATSSISPSLNRACRSRTVETSIPQRTGFPPSPSADVSAARRASKSMASTSATRP
ncbi:MAG TPA: carboxypeptidase-like regulatory domain-containing protein [Candidatus Angelobacter sp.]|nr:carboxypeptidase-like regulatory domain-containing protein [Candidatus Angelobacter sp.]